ncbi:SDR family oxidoreductase [Trebonia kvetii]|uniref:SDR family oxidoreductase n=1 Tax=Trebonia kvetii TaxID=2480626 RepID=A0A6P2BSW9_9ACTN|nr:SDR family NAD(P)-dependent oxidoreductase [Trebonia kvetii]TVZ02124.1 SDR family oxidoreductase [Trebonia kvetii]
MPESGSAPVQTGVVTGGGAGIGAAICRRLARDGWYIIVNDIEGPAGARTAARIRQEGGQCALVVGAAHERRVGEEIRGLITDARGGRIDLLVNNVGDFRPATRTFTASSPANWQQMYELNLLHVFRLTHALLPLMIARQAGSIVNVSTVEAFRGIPGHAVYSAFKAGVVAFTRSLAVEVGQHGVRVNAIGPDLINTEQTPRAAMLRGRPEESVRSWVPLGRFGDPDDCAAVVEFLASPAAGFVTGHTITVDGGTLAASGWYGRADGKGFTNLPNEA